MVNGRKIEKGEDESPHVILSFRADQKPKVNKDYLYYLAVTCSK